MIPEARLEVEKTRVSLTNTGEADLQSLFTGSRESNSVGHFAIHDYDWTIGSTREVRPG